jgi:D-allose transport system substrate-binding protein
MKISKRLVVVLACVLLVLGATSFVSAAGTEKGTIVVGVLLKTLANPYWVSMKGALESEVKNMPGVKLDIFAAQSEADITGQMNMLQDMINSGKYDAIAVAPITPTNCISVVVAANKKGIPVVNIDEKFDMKALAQAGGYVVGYATSDNIKVGEAGAKLIMEKVGKFGSGDGVCIVEGLAGATSGELRRDGAEKGFKAAGVTLLADQPGDWDRQKSLDVATNMINKFGAHLKGIFTANDTMALGVLQAMENTGRMDICLVSTDANPEVRQAINEGKLAAVVQSPGGIGIACVKMAVKAAMEKNPGSLGVEPETQLIPATIVTPPNW